MEIAVIEGREEARGSVFLMGTGVVVVAFWVLVVMRCAGSVWWGAGDGRAVLPGLWDSPAWVDAAGRSFLFGCVPGQAPVVVVADPGQG
ncbi:hypothetical protein E1295_00475 [Nonomuraea mesophila]|uniref:Uncharacterized protein n=1 Tax=Nonomuraea mesophila TaxID=2530382 RepID=A0A4R5FY47_9ACTN|nr:hypothetical protein [Nonomuraea mesophila]TDE60352.1 hypothetical protein E1295_00475 [Nonomuraea mesophila]